MLNNMKIGKRLAVGFGLVLLLLLVVGGTGYWGITSSTGTTIAMLQGDAQVAEHSARARANVLGLRRFEKDLFLNVGNKEKEAEYLKKWKEQQEHLTARLADLEKVAIQAKDKEMVNSMKKDLADYDEGFKRVYNQVDLGQIKTPQEGNQAIGQYKDEMHRLEQLAQDLATEGQTRMEAKEQIMKDLARHTMLIMVITILLAVAASFAIGTFITRSIVNPLGVAVGIANKLSAGDLTTNVEATSGDEVGQLLAA
ncbi:MAG TPA: MCP four helix bundle domain-containing protein, partial [Geobacteraceae bacterium]|nr:MCP four helix bundle domain-containing protein [Geobacteraceae bacterium]